MADKTLIKFTGVGPLRKIFDDARRSAESSSVLVGYTANYALYVHEMVNAVFQRPGAKAKFLEEPLRLLKDELIKGIEKDLAAGLDMEKALYRAGLKLQRASQEIVPVDTGNLRASAFTRVE